MAYSPDALEDRAQSQIVLADRLLRGALLGGVANEAHHRRAGFGLHWLEHDVDGKFRAILAQAEEIEGRAHLAGAGMGGCSFRDGGDGCRGSAREPGFSTGWPMISCLL